MNYLESIAASLDRGYPFIAVTTQDYPETVAALVGALQDRPVLHWDLPRGAVGLNELGVESSDAMNSSNEPATTTSKFEECLERALDLMPPRSVLIMDDVHLILDNQDRVIRAHYIQAIRNCREMFKSSERCLIFLCPSIQLPLELANDVEIIDVPLPDVVRINARTEELMEAAALPKPDDATKKRVADALLGLTAFAGENALVKSFRKTGIDFDDLMGRKKAYIRQIPCLSVPPSVSTFDQLGGLDAIKDYGRQIIAGKNKPRLVVLWDEVDKWIASLGDSNGINADALGQLLGAMEDNGWDGITLPGFAGTGKTEWAKALGNEAGGLFLQMDLGGAKGGIVGDSERMVRQAIAMLKAMGGEKVLFVATCNDMSIMQRKPELLRRLAYGVHFYDLPTADEQIPIWDLYIERFGIPDQTPPPCEGWTGAEIKKVCKLADEFGKPLAEVAAHITPVVTTMGDGVNALRDQAAKGSWISAKTGNPYTKRPPTANAVRKMKGIQ